MFYTDELRRLTPLAWLALFCLAAWAAAFYAWPFWTGVVIAIAFGVIGSYLFGDWLRARIRIRTKKDDEVKREKIQNEFDELAERRRR